MRRITLASLRHWNLAPLIPDATLLVSELVTNAIRHGDGRAVLLSVEHHTTELRIAVTDGTSTLPTLHDARDDDEHGRGLHLVAAIVDAWGVSPGEEPRGAPSPFSRAAPGDRRSLRSRSASPRGAVTTGCRGIRLRGRPVRRRCGRRGRGSTRGPGADG
ncbi:ATP-binding protein [Streptomyces sp. NPDC057638]|uniref:ATP-binding protein n=1 Tax=Streptomyces sp. NPDC057638 TaxID=3346190 RepID=UPI0036BB8836